MKINIFNINHSDYNGKIIVTDKKCIELFEKINKKDNK